MRVLFVHQNFPGQYLHLAPALAARGDDVVAMAIEAQQSLPGVRVACYKPHRGSSASVHPWVLDIETKVIRGEAAAHCALELREKGFRPDVICAHPGWGEALFLKDVFPETRLLSFIEFFYRANGADYDFDPEFPEDDLPGRCRLRMKNANSLLNEMSVALWRGAYLGRTLRSRAIGAAFSLFSSLRIVAYLPMLWAIAMSSDSSQHSLLTWLLWLGSNLSTALWLHDRGTGVRGAVLVSLSNTVMCALAVALILALRA